tara:strand:- start:270 stop:497 length:228 start_codon:yes stop_codon:yes gene_type:complete
MLDAMRRNTTEGTKAVIKNSGADRIKNKRPKLETYAKREKVHSPNDIESGTKFKYEEPINKVRIKLPIKNQNSVL